MKIPLVSVVMSVYNGEKYLHEAIESILNQSLTDFEFIIINDGSTDSSEKIILSYEDLRIVYLSQENQGLAKSLNRGINIARGEYIARMDADDRSHPDRLNFQFGFMHSHPEYILLGTQTIVMSEDGTELYTTELPTEDKQIRLWLPLRSPFFHGSVLMRKEAFYKAGCYNEEIIHFIEDLLLWNKMSNFGCLANLPRPLYYYRLVPGAISNRTPNIERKLHNIIERTLKSETLSNKDKEVLIELKNKSRYMLISLQKASYFLKLGRAYFEKTEHIKKARYYFFTAVKEAPFYWRGWFYIFLSFLPFSIGKKWRIRRTKMSRK